MRVMPCDQCDTPLPWNAQYCTTCGASISLHPQISDYDDAPDDPEQYTKRPDSLKTYAFYTMGASDPDETQHIDRSHTHANNTPLPAISALDDSTSSYDFIE